MAYLMLAWALFEATRHVAIGEFSTSFNSEPVGVNQGQNLKLPTQIAVSVKDGFSPFSDDSYFTVKAQARIIHESDTNEDKPREKYNLEVTDCVIGEDEFNSPLPAKCITFDEDHWDVKGTYDEDIYKYIQIYLSACQDSSHDIFQDAQDEILPNRHHLKCAPQQNITSMFFSPNAGVNVALWVREQQDFGIWKWKSRSYHTVTEKWVGVETYVRNVRLKKYGTLSLPTGDVTYREVSLTEIRESPIKVDEYNQYGEFLKFYLRAADEEVEIIHTKYGFVQAMELIGSAWSCLTLTIGSIAIWFNQRQYMKEDANDKANDVEVDPVVAMEAQGTPVALRRQFSDDVNQKIDALEQRINPRLASLTRQFSGTVNEKLADLENKYALSDMENRLEARHTALATELGTEMGKAVRIISQAMESSSGQENDYFL